MTDDREKVLGALRTWVDRLYDAIHGPIADGRSAYQLVHELDLDVDACTVLAWMTVIGKARIELKEVIDGMEWNERPPRRSRKKKAGP